MKTSGIQGKTTMSLLAKRYPSQFPEDTAQGRLRQKLVLLLHVEELPRGACPRRGAENR